ncbi:hypothetical protein SNOG_14146 [Parastagonospora nodorum SN15]|uniref:Uncharacterized protein n=1 Tax=Phaeosphaeria nodorum (strain SN15 / ATCC MYA-4574 / FGSC 10173) TaxID=321614 RepID=Q0U1Y4_PHANO|nr:hypothetical protein SNOG_14146 [Parastagonospora nodorum SN15]EAT78383.1 hypothetical protein SNOG_14146 [Parastagonospora nodorum SN15]
MAASMLSRSTSTYVICWPRKDCESSGWILAPSEVQDA